MAVVGGIPNLYCLKAVCNGDCAACCDTSGNKRAINSFVCYQCQILFENAILCEGAAYPVVVDMIFEI